MTSRLQQARVGDGASDSDIVLEHALDALRAEVPAPAAWPCMHASAAPLVPATPSLSGRKSGLHLQAGVHLSTGADGGRVDH